MGIAYSPADPLVAPRVKLVVVETTVTVAPGTTALLESVTVPEIVPDSACPNSDNEASKTTPSTAKYFLIL